jgi:hypothetical protein
MTARRKPRRSCRVTLTKSLLFAKLQMAQSSLLTGPSKLLFSLLLIWISLKETSCSLANHYLRLSRFLIPNDFQAIQFHAIIRKRLELGKETAITLFVNNKKILTSDSQMQDVYERMKAPDGFLYITFKEGEHFGY